MQFDRIVLDGKVWKDLEKPVPQASFFLNRLLQGKSVLIVDNGSVLLEDYKANLRNTTAVFTKLGFDKRVITAPYMPLKISPKGVLLRYLELAFANNAPIVSSDPAMLAYNGKSPIRDCMCAMTPKFSVLNCEEAAHSLC